MAAAPKAAWIDSADGGHTNVEFCQDYLLVPESRARALTLRQIGYSFDVGVYHYATRSIPAGLVQPSVATIKKMTEVVMYRYGEFHAK